DDVRAPTPGVITERAARHHEHRHREAVRRDHPLDARLARVELMLDVGDRDVHDHRVEIDHEQPETGRDERPPSAPAVRVSGHRAPRHEMSADATMATIATRKPPIVSCIIVTSISRNFCSISTWKSLSSPRRSPT